MHLCISLLLIQIPLCTSRNMKIMLVSIVVHFLPFVVQLTSAETDAKSKSSKTYHHSSSGYYKPSLISFDSEEGNIDIDWDITIPFISIPLKNRQQENGEVSPLVRVNTKGLGIVGLVTTILPIIVPLFSKPTPAGNYRSSESTQWLEMGSTVNEIIFGNNYVTPCLQRILCSAVSVASRSESPTSIEKIIDGISSHQWFKDAVNGTIIQDAVKVGREGNRDCVHVYKDCLVTPKVFKTLMAQFGIV